MINRYIHRSIMPSVYSLDLRQKAIAAIDRGEKKSHVSRTLKISRNTLELWLKRREETGSLAPKTPSQKGPVAKINDLVAFEQFASEQGHLTAQQMAEQWSQPVSDVTLGKALKRIGFTRKKRLMGIVSGTKLNAEPFES